MTRVFNDPKNFVEDALTGLTAAYPRYLMRVHGGVVSAAAAPAGQVSVIVGGGSGHYPAFAGWVGPGLADGAVCGNIFASPSASQAYSVCKAADNGGGIILAFGNYAGDRLHFGQAAEQLRAEGVDVRIVTVTDDVKSEPIEKLRDRRGLAGDLVVFKIAGAAAARGKSLDEVEELAWRVNDWTKSYGVAFDGCTLPGADAPLFTVPDGQMSLALGVHGEPGIREVPMGTAAEIADELVDGVLAEAPTLGEKGYNGRAAVIVNGLGTIKYEELFVVYGRVAERLAAAGITPVLPEVGEIMGSLDMAGLSLTVAFLDDELEALWSDPVDTPAFRRGAVATTGTRAAVSTEVAAAEIAEGAPESQELAATVAVALAKMAQVAVDQEEELGRIDALAGDGDHGMGMRLGALGAVKAGERALAAKAGASTLLSVAGADWSESAGGTSGALWGVMLTAFGRALGDEGVPTAKDVVTGVNAALDAVVSLGGAQVGDKTMVDAIVPFAETLTAEVEAGTALPQAWRKAHDVAKQAAEDTAKVVSKVGRSHVLGEKSLGVPDPGAISFCLMMQAIADAKPFGE